MDINRANLDAMFRTYTTAFQAGLAYVAPIDLAFAFREFPSGSASNFYAWLDRVPGFREWVGERVFNNVRSQNFEVVNRDWEDSVSILNKDIEDDNYGVYGPIIQMMAEGWPELKFELVLEVLTSNPTCYTGVAYFADNHAYGDNTIANLVTSALSETTFNAAFLAAAAWKFANGKPTRTRFTHLFHGPKLRDTAFNLVDNKYIVAETGAGGHKDNPNYKRVERVEVPDFTGTYDDYWMLLDCSRPVKPIALQVRKQPTPIMDTRIEQVMRTGQVDFMADARAAAAPTFPHLAYAGIL